MERNTVLIIDGSETSTLKELLEKRTEVKIIGSTNNVDLGFTMAERNQPAIILLNVDLPGDKGFNVAEVFALEFPAASLVLVTESDNKRILRHALQVGAKEVINLPVNEEQLFAIIKRVLEHQVKRREVFSVEKKSRPQFKTITVFSTKGGVGKTTIALNLAIAIKQLTKKRAVLVDLDLMAGNIAMMAGVTLKRSIKDLVDEINNLDEELLDKCCFQHSSGIKILPAPIQPEYSGFIEAEHVEKVLSHLSQVFNYVIVDTPAYLHDTLMPALELSQDIIMVTTLDLASIQNLKQCLDLLNGLSMRSKAKVVVNKMGQSRNLKIKDLEDALGMEVHAIIPSCEEMAIDAVNMGKPFQTSAKNSPAARQIEELAKKMMAKEDYRLHEDGVLGKLARR